MAWHTAALFADEHMVLLLLIPALLKGIDSYINPGWKASDSCWAFYDAQWQIDNPGMTKSKPQINIATSQWSLTPMFPLWSLVIWNWQILTNEILSLWEIHFWGGLSLSLNCGGLASTDQVPSAFSLKSHCRRECCVTYRKCKRQRRGREKENSAQQNVYWWKHRLEKRKIMVFCLDSVAKYIRFSAQTGISHDVLKCTI